jgi:integrase
VSKAANMQALVESFLVCRRQAGYELRIDGEQLFRFAAFADQSGHVGPLTRELATGWATFQPRNDKLNRLTAARRIEVLRGFARYHQQFEADTEIPPLRLFGKAHQRKVPHIYSDTEIHNLLNACTDLHPAGGLRGLSCRTIIGLLWATGMRISEVTGLTHGDIDLDAGLIEVQSAKFGKSRWVPIQSSVVSELKRYVQQRSLAFLPASMGDAYFVSDYGKPMTTRSVRYAFGLLCKQLGLQARGDHKYPRLHDIRHTFITSTLQRWQEQGIDIDKNILALSTYVGHVKVTDTYWYVTATPTLMATAAIRFAELCDEEVVS